jgi:hypothetical protein
MLDVLASSLASQLLQGSVAHTGFVNHTKHCRSRLAGEGGMSGNRDAGCPGLFAGKLSSHRGFLRTQDLSATQNTVGAGLPAKAVCQATGMLDVPASSLASQLLQGFSANTGFVSHTTHCRSRLAGEGGVSGNRDAGCAGLFAGKPAPTGIFCEHRICEPHKTL